MALKQRNEILLAKIETTAGVDAVPTGAANAIQAKNIDMQPLSVDFADRGLVQPYFGASPGIVVGRRAVLSFEVELAGSGVAGTPPAWAPLIKACAFTETDTAIDDTYLPNSTAPTTLSMWVNIDGVNHKLLYGRGTFVLALNAKGFPVLRFTFTGNYGGIADAAAPTPVYTAFIAPVSAIKANVSAFSFFGISSALCLSSLEIDVGNEVVKRELITCERVDITDRNVTGKLVVEATLMADWNWPAAVDDGTLGALSIQHGQTAGNIVVVSAPKVQITNPTYSEDQGVLMLNLDLLFTPNAGNDELSIVVK